MHLSDRDGSTVDAHDHIEDALGDLLADDPDLLHTIRTDTQFSELQDALIDDADGKTVGVNVSLDLALERVSRQTRMWLLDEAPHPARHIADLVRGRVPAEST